MIKIMMSLLSISSFLYSMDIEIPHEIIYKNPKREIKIVESKRLREKAELDITVTKVDIEDIQGIRLKNNDVLFNIPQDKIKKDYTFKVVKDFKRNIHELEFKHEVDKNQDLIKLNIANFDEVYIVKTEKTTFNPIKIFRGKIQNTKTTLLGSLKFEIDSRMLNFKDRWLNKAGKLSSGINDVGLDYSEILNVSVGNFSNLPATGKIIKEGAAMEERTLQKDDNGALIFADNTDSLGAIITGKELSNLSNDMKIALNTTPTELKHNKFNLKGDTGIEYSGDIEEVYSDKPYNTAKATLEIYEYSLGSTATWKPSVNGLPPVASGATYPLKFIEGSLFDVRGINRYSIANKMVVIEDGKETIITGGVREVREYDGTHIKFTIATNGNFSIKKKTDYNKFINYKITPYYNNLELGSLSIEIKNSRKSFVGVGEATFTIDNRIKSNTKGNWIDSKGNLKTRINEAPLENYSELVRVSNNFGTLNSTIKDYIGVEGRSVKESGPSDYDYFKVSQGDNKDISAMHKNIPFNNFSETMHISKNNGTNPLLLNNTFDFIDNNGRLYNGNILEVYKGEEVQIASATLDLASLTKGEFGEWSSNATGEISGGKVKMIITPGEKLFNVKGINGYSIADRVEIITNNGPIENISGTVNTPISYNGQHNSFTIYPDGKLRIIKNSDSTDEINYKIIPYYKDIVLGELNIAIKNKQPITIEGGDILDFGDIVQGDQSIATSILKIKDLPNGNTVKITIENNIEMNHTTINSMKIPVVLETGLIKKGTTTEIGLRGTINTKLENNAGEYEGATNIIITIQ